MEMQELRLRLQKNGVVGAGGAGFPSYAKLDQRINTIILNCAECEPLLRVHRQMLAKYAFEILQALSITAKAVHAKEVIIAIKKSYCSTIEAVEAVLEQMDPTIVFQIKLLPEVYPAGDEVITIYETTKKVVPPGKLPLDVGIAVFNVETMYNTYLAIKKEIPVTHKYLTIAGAVRNPKTVRVPIGIKISEVVKLAGGVTVLNPVYVHGGPMTGPIVKKSDVITKTSNAILVFDQTHTVIVKKTGQDTIHMKRAMASCCQCRMCTDLCPRYLLGHPIEPHSFMRAATSGNTRDVEPFLNTFYCSQCGLCEMYSCNQCLAPKSLIGSYRDKLRKAKVLPNPHPSSRSVAAERNYRGVPMERLIARLSLTEYNHEAPITSEKVKTTILCVRLNQHIGAPASCTVKVGEKVEKGQVIAKPDKETLSVYYHAPMDGVILNIANHCVMIEAANSNV